MSDITGSGDNDGINLDNPNLNVLRRINPELLGRLNLSGMLGRTAAHAGNQARPGNPELGCAEPHARQGP